MADQMSQEKLFGRYQEVILLLLGFILTTVIGGLLTDRYQRHSWTLQHSVQNCEADREARTKGFAQLNDRMDRRLLIMRNLVWKLEIAQSLKDVAEERKGNLEARDEWSSQLNSTLAFTEVFFGTGVRNTLENDISSNGFAKIHGRFNSFFKKGRLDKGEASDIENEIDAFNPVIYQLDLQMEKIIVDQARACSAVP